MAAGSVLAGLSRRTPSTADAGRAVLAGLVSVLAGAVLPLLTPIGPAAEPLSPLALLVQPRALPLLADLFIIATAGGAFAVPLYVLIQHRAAPGSRARVIAAYVVNARHHLGGPGTACGHRPAARPRRGHRRPVAGEAPEHRRGQPRPWSHLCRCRPSRRTLGRGGG
ncbi:hypothetical protein M5E06_15750 [Azospirillum sp. A1-3]|uniref:hypothetical protein n=1 Tax=Azospirillum sp. A1-3 TaxID=185874 RepID=UPI0020771A2D|nr:hypothetical protein [Azospirillum sp. A1-3]MCM8735605.1 hypothetical protein [Azospirillum sp. A1-3]